MGKYDVWDSVTVECRPNRILNMRILVAVVHIRQTNPSVFSNRQNRSRSDWLIHSTWYKTVQAVLWANGYNEILVPPSFFYYHILWTAFLFFLFPSFCLSYCLFITHILFTYVLYAARNSGLVLILKKLRNPIQSLWYVI